MRLQDITIGGRYLAKISGHMTMVRVLAIREDQAWGSTRGSTRPRVVHRIDVVNERTGRRTTFRSAARLRRPAPQPPGAEEP